MIYYILVIVCVCVYTYMYSLFVCLPVCIYLPIYLKLFAGSVTQKPLILFLMSTLLLMYDFLCIMYAVEIL